MKKGEENKQKIALKRGICLKIASFWVMSFTGIQIMQILWYGGGGLEWSAWGKNEKGKRKKEENYITKGEKTFCAIN